MGETQTFLEVEENLSTCTVETYPEEIEPQYKHQRSLNRGVNRRPETGLIDDRNRA